MTETEFRTQMAENLINFRKTFGYTQAELAEKIQYSDKSISKWERGEGMPDAYVLKAIATVYGITVSDLIGETTPAKDISKAVKRAAAERAKAKKAAEKIALKEAKKNKSNEK